MDEPTLNHAYNLSREAIKHFQSAIICKFEWEKKYGAEKRGFLWIYFIYFNFFIHKSAYHFLTLLKTGAKFYLNNITLF